MRALIHGVSRKDPTRLAAKTADNVTVHFPMIEAAPNLAEPWIDVWIERVLRETYFQNKRRITARRLRDFSASYFGDFGGYAQQYLFHHARKTRGRVQK